MGNPLAQKTFTVRRAQKPSHTFLRYSNDGGKTFTPAKPWVETGEYGNGRNLFGFNLGLKTDGGVLDRSINGFRATRATLYNRIEHLWKRFGTSMPSGRYRLGGLIRADEDVSVTLQMGDVNTEGGSIEATTEWKPFSVVGRNIKYLGADSYGFIDVEYGVAKSGNSSLSVYLKDFMLTMGDEYYDYTPAPEDQAPGTTPGKYLGTLVWDKPYPSPDTADYTWSEVQGRDAVIRHSPNGLWFSNADTGRIEGYNGKWLVITYPYHTGGPVCKELLEGSGTAADGCFQVTDEVMNTTRFAPDGNNREWFSYYAVTYAYFTEATTVAYTARTDDRSALYVNDRLLYNIETCTDTPVSINFDKGWNKVEFILEEGVSEQYTHLDPWISKSTNCLGIDCSQAGTIPADYLGTLNGDGVLDFMKYSWAKVRGEDGRPGSDAVSVLLSTELITVDTDDNGAVPPEALNNAYADVKAYRGNKRTAVTANVVSTSNPGTRAIAEADRIKIISIGVDPSTGYAYGSGYVNIDAIVAGTPYPLRLFVGTNLHKITSKWVQDNEHFRSELGELKKDYNGNKTQWDTAIRQNKEAIGLKVGKTEFDANNNMVSAQISQIKVESDSIRLSVEAIKGGARNLLVGSGFRKRDEVPWNGSDTYCSIVKSNGYKGSNAVYVNSTATAQAFAGVCFPKVPVKPSTRYSLSVMAMSPDISSFTAAASVEIREYTSDTEFTRIAAPSLIPDKNGVYKTVKTAFTTRPDTRHLSVFFYVVKAGRLYICRPMLEEGEYKGWSLSENDFDYTGGNLLDGSRLLDGSNLVVKNGTVIEHGYGEFSAIHCDNTSGSSYVDVLQWSNDNNALGLKANTDYMLSMWVKSNGLFQSFLYGTEHATVYAEGSDGMSNSVSDGYTSAALTDTWKKVWVHWRTGSTVPRYILPVRLHKGNSATVAGVKLEEGATVTEYTESRTDMVSKQALLATGIDITNRKVVVTGDNVVLQNTQGNVTAQLNKDGKLNTELIEATKVVTEGIKAKEIDAEFARFKNMIVEGAVSSPYTTVGSGFDLTRHDNAWLGGNNEWVNNFNLKWDVSQRGRTLHLSNYGTSLPTTGVGKINAPSGKWFFDNGRKFSQLLVYPGTVVVLHGLGDENTFHGWLVEQRHDPSHNKTGVPFRAFAWGFATCSKTGDADFENYRTFDGSRLGISRMGAGWCRITMPYAWYSILQTYGSHWYHHFGVIATGYGYSEDGANEFCPIKASVKSMGLNGNTPYVDIWLSDDDTANDGRFQFIFYNMDFNDGFQTSDNR